MPKPEKAQHRDKERRKKEHGMRVSGRNTGKVYVDAVTKRARRLKPANSDEQPGA